MTLRERLRRFGDGPGGAREVLGLGLPLVLSHASYTIQSFLDRLFLTWYSPEAMAGAVTGAFATLGAVGLFMATGEYLTTFVAQYVGAGRPERVGVAVWQGVWFSLAAGAILAAAAPFARPFFLASGHDPALVGYETEYARVLLLGGVFAVLMASLASFFAGRGETRVILAVNLFVTVVNGVFNWFLIFGNAGFPRLGVTGAAIATVLSQAAGAATYAVLILKRHHRERYGTARGWRPERDLLGRLVRFGLPAGLHFSVEIGWFALFLVIVGRIGTAELGATGIAFNLNGIVFVPMLGLGLGVSSLVGRHLGAGRVAAAERTTWSAFWMSWTYMCACGLAYVLLPALLIAPYAAQADPRTFPAMGALAAVLLRYVALYSIFDMMNVIFASGLKGAGDTRHPLLLTSGLGLVFLLVLPWLLCVRGGFGIHAAWWSATAYVTLVGLLMLRRFRAGGWKTLRVIEPGVVSSF